MTISLDDLQPDVLVRCLGEGAIDVRAAGGKKKRLSFADDFWLSDGAVADWPYFARWHYRSHELGFVRRVVLLWHGSEAVGICVFAAPAAASAALAVLRPASAAIGASTSPR